MHNHTNNICVVGADSAGHLVPALTLALQWQQAHPSAKILVCTGNKQLENNVVSRYDIDEILKVSGVRLSSSIGGSIRCFVSIIRAFFLALFFLYKHKPHHVVSTGGLLCIPIVFAARILGIRRIIYEFNATPGRATRFLAYFADEIKIVFSSCKNFWPKNSCIRDKCELVNYPIRFTEKNTSSFSITDETIFFQEHRKTLFIMGGSQGSLFLNNRWYELLVQSSLLCESVQIIHQTGSNDQRDWSSFYKQLGIPAIVFSYKHNFGPYYHCADYVLSRAGAGALFEISFFKKRALIIPLVTPATSHQLDNAYAMQEKYPELLTILVGKEVDSKFQDTLLAHFLWDVQTKKCKQGWRDIS